MRKLFVLLLFFTYSTISVMAQNKSRHLIIADSLTHKGIPQATVIINNYPSSATDANGAVRIDESIIGAKFNIRVSCVGYKPLSVEVNPNYPPADTIKLSPLTVALNEVEIKPVPLTRMNAAYVKKPYVDHRSTSPEDAYAQFIPNEKKIEGIITSVQFELNDVLQGIEKPFRVRLFTKRKDSITLDKELTKDSIVVSDTERKKLMSVDISKYNIQLPENGVIVVFETLAPEYYGKDSTTQIYRTSGMLHVAKRAKTPGLELYYPDKKSFLDIDHSKTDRKGPYAMVGPQAEYWNWNDVHDQWFIYAEGINFGISITVKPNE